MDDTSLGSSKELLERAVDAAISTMQRNRTLLFFLNLLAAIVLTVVYLERFSFDESIRDAYVFNYQSTYKELGALGVPDSLLQANEGVSKQLEAIEAWAIHVFEHQGQSVNKELIGSREASDWMRSVSGHLLRLSRTYNEKTNVVLPKGTTLPVGIAIPRNDIVPIAGVMMVLLYSWLYFSFVQLARITTTLRGVFTSNNSLEKSNEEKKLNKSLFEQIVGLHFLFRTSTKGFSSTLVKILYYSSPISLLIALVNDIYSIKYYKPTTADFRGFLYDITLGRLIIVGGLFVILAIIAYNIRNADTTVNTTSYSLEE